MTPRRAITPCVAVCAAAVLVATFCPFGAKAQDKAKPRVATMPLSAKIKKAVLGRELFKVRAKIDNVRGRLRTAKRSEAVIAADLEAIRKRLAETRVRLLASETDLARARRGQALTVRALRASGVRLQARETTLAQRMAANYRQGPVRYASVLLGSRSLGEMGTRARFVRAVVRYDADLIAEIKAARADVIARKAQADAKAAQAQRAQITLRAIHAEETEGVARQRAVLAEAREARAALENELNALEQDSNAITTRLQALSLTPQGKARLLLPFAGVLMRPVPGPVISPFGMRYHPILHRTRLHAGLDFKGETGTPIAAAGNGVVVFSGVMRGYGNVVVIDHGGGVSTLYGHCSVRIAVQGQTVTKGDIIAKIGQTGLATGPHLHFEVRKTGKPVDPLTAL